MKIILPGKPIPLSRPRVSHTARMLYDAQRQQKIHHAIEMKYQYDNGPLLTGPIEMVVTFYMEVPANKKRSYREALIGTPHIARPDLSNLIKYIEDAAHNVFFKDDAIICSIIATKVYDEQPRTEFEFRPYTPNGTADE